MIRLMKSNDLLQCGEIYAKAFPMEYWGIDWTAENAKEYQMKHPSGVQNVNLFIALPFFIHYTLTNIYAL